MIHVCSTVKIFFSFFFQLIENFSIVDCIVYVLAAVNDSKLDIVLFYVGVGELLTENGFT